MDTARYSQGRRPPQLTSHRASLWALLGTRGAGARRQSQGGSVGTARGPGQWRETLNVAGCGAYIRIGGNRGNDTRGGKNNTYVKTQ